MNKPNVSNLIKGARIFVDKHTPEILVGFGVAGMLTTTVLAVRSTPKALALIEEEKRKRDVDKLPAIDVVKVAWKPYVPSAVTCACSIACLVGASSVNLRRNAALATAYKLSETALAEYRDKVIETVGENKEQKIREKVAKDRIEKHPVTQKEVIITEKGNTLCFDTISARYFRSDIEKIKRVANELNRQMLTDAFGYVSVNDFYDELGLEHISVGNDLGWNVSTGLINIEIGSGLAADDTPCVVIDYTVAPKYDFIKYS